MANKQSANGVEELKKMKSWALNSGYPLENDVAQVLAKFKNQRTMRNFPFVSENNEGDTAIRSIDFKTCFEYPTQTVPTWPRGPAEKASLIFFIDAKYSEAEKYWFTPSEQARELSFPHLIPVLLKDQYGRDIKIYRQDYEKASQAPSGCQVATDGKKTKDQTKERNSLADYQVQMIGALQAAIEEKTKCLGQTEVGDSYFRDIYVYVPIVATNAPLCLLKPNISSTGVHKATKTEDLVTVVDKVLVTQPNLFYVKEALKKLASKISTHTANRLSWLKQDLTGFPIFFVNISSIEETISSMNQAFESVVNATWHGAPPK